MPTVEEILSATPEQLRAMRPTTGGCSYCSDCFDCSRCSYCFDLDDKKHCFCNVQLTPEQYASTIAKLKE